jgi:hypothetical protein
MTDSDLELEHRLARGAYVVDSAAVAEAIVARLTKVLEAGEVGWPALDVEEDGAGAPTRDA